MPFSRDRLPLLAMLAMLVVLASLAGCGRPSGSDRSATSAGPRRLADDPDDGTVTYSNPAALGVHDRAHGFASKMPPPKASDDSPQLNVAFVAQGSK
jgi:hypothetical protein